MSDPAFRLQNLIHLNLFLILINTRSLQTQLRVGQNPYPKLNIFTCYNWFDKGPNLYVLHQPIFFSATQTVNFGGKKNCPNTAILFHGKITNLHAQDVWGSF